MNTGHDPIQCAHCGHQDRPPAVEPFLVTDSKGNHRHIWLHRDKCKAPWFARHRERQQQRRQAA